MNLETITSVVPVASAVGAAVGGAISFVVNWYWKVHELTDKIQVHYGSSLYEETPGYAMYVISRRKHEMELRDYGFVLADGRLISAPMVWEQRMGDEGDHDEASASRVLPSVNSRFEINIELGHKAIVGAYAQTTSQRRPTIDFAEWAEMSWIRKLRIRLKQRFDLEYA